MDQLPVLWLGAAFSGKLTAARTLAGVPVDGTGLHVEIVEVSDGYTTRIFRGNGIVEIDITDMSMQDKQILPELLTRLLVSGDVSTGLSGKKRIVILRRVHAMSLATALRIRGLLEEYCTGPHQQTRVWMTARELNGSVSILEDLFTVIAQPVKKPAGKLQDARLPIHYTRELLDKIIDYEDIGTLNMEVVFWVRARTYELLGQCLTTQEITDLFTRAIEDAIIMRRLKPEIAASAIQWLTSQRWIASYRTPLLIERMILQLFMIITNTTKD